MRGSRLLSTLGLSLVMVSTPSLAQDNPWMSRRVLNMAHRGGAHEAPEHTLYAYKTALPKGVNTLDATYGQPETPAAGFSGTRPGSY